MSLKKSKHKITPTEMTADNTIAHSHQADNSLGNSKTVITKTLHANPDTQCDSVCEGLNKMQPETDELTKRFKLSSEKADEIKCQLEKHRRILEEHGRKLEEHKRNFRILAMDAKFVSIFATL